MTHPTLHTHPSAFSLVEVLFAVFLLSIILFGVIRLEVSQFRLTETQKNEVQAHSLAHQNVEQMVALGKTEIDLACDPNESCQCEIAGGVLSCSENAQQTSEIFTQYLLVNKTDLVDAWQVSSIAEWEDATGLHDAENGGGAVIKRIVY